MSAPGRVLVVGGDAAGTSAASRIACRSPGTRVTVLERETVVSYAACGMPYHLDGRVPDAASLLVRSPEQFAAAGIDVRRGHEVTALDRAAGKVTVRADGVEQTESYDALLLATGARAVVPPVPDAGSGAVTTDANLRTSDEAIWAAGDCTGTTDLVTGRRTWVPLGPAANKQGRAAGDSVLGRPARFPGVVGTSLVKAFALEVGRTGLTAEQAAATDFDVVTTRITGTDRAHYYPGARETAVLLHADRPTGRLLGAQVVGHAGVAGRTKRAGHGPACTEERVLGIFDSLRDWFGTPSFRGCAFVNATVELADPDHPAREAVLEHTLRTRVGRRAGDRLRRRAAGFVARQIVQLTEGAITTALVESDPTAADIAAPPPPK